MVTIALEGNQELHSVGEGSTPNCWHILFGFKQSKTRITGVGEKAWYQKTWGKILRVVSYKLTVMSEIV